MSNTYLINREKGSCCGCQACSHICPVGAIVMTEDERGFSYPKINVQRCINCGLCQKVCPMTKSLVKETADPDCYAVCSQDKAVLKESSSGGMFTLLAQWVLKQSGVIYGVAFDECFRVKHERAVTMEEAEAFRTSKYVESDITKVYETIAEDLKEGRVVLLTGTPCQISGVQRFLALKRVDTERLYTCENICHGVPSHVLWDEYVRIFQEKIGSDNQITGINMRSKERSWEKRSIRIKVLNGSVDKEVDAFPFNRLFQSLTGHRASCFECRYTSFKRAADFTLGDFWNVENAGIQFDTKAGVNLVLVNTPKGRKAFEELRVHANVQQTTKQAAWQPHLEYSSKKPGSQDAFWEAYLNSNNKEAVMRKYMNGTLLTKMIRVLSPLLRKTGLFGLAGKMYKLVFTGKKSR